MTRQFSDQELFKFQQEAQTLTTPSVTTMQALHKIAQREGYKDCASLEKGRTQLSAPPYSDDRGESDLQPTTRAEVLKILQHRIQVGTDDETTLLFRNGTVWIQSRDIKANTVGLDSFIFLGCRFDGHTQQYSSGLGLLADMDGMAEVGRLETETDIDDDDELYGGYQVLTMAQAKKLLIEAVQDDFDSKYDEFITAALNEDVED